MKKHLTYLLVLLMFLNLYVSPVYALQPDTKQFTNNISIQPKINRDEKPEKRFLKENRKKISSNLLKLLDETLIPSGQTKQQIITQMKSMKALVTPQEAKTKGLAPASDNLVYVYISLRPGSDTNVVKPLVNKITNQSQKDNLVVAWVEAGKLDTLSELDEVCTIVTVQPPIVNSGSVISEGDDILQTKLFRNLSGINGTGMKVGIISDGVDSWTQARDTGDLPSDLIVLSNEIHGDEGTALAEIVYDLAPGAQIYFHDCGTDTVAFLNAIQSLVDAGCNIIVDDISWPDEPFFEDGQPALNLKSILANNNVLYISAAGNAAQSHYKAKFRDDGYGFHNFNTCSGPTLLPVYIPAGSTMTTVLQWNDKFGSSNNDYDLYFRDADFTIISSSDNQQGPSFPFPLEYVQWNNNSGADMIGYIDIRKYAGVRKTIELYVYGALLPSSYATAADSIYGHQALPEVITVGAITASTPNEIAYYSSQGPVAIDYPTRQLRNKPDVCGIDGVLVTGVGGFPSPFYGTSAAAPHTAAIAALIWAQSPTKKAAEISNLIKNGTVDLGARGFDYIYGYGREDVFYATPPFTPTGLSAAPSDKSAVLTWTANAETDLASYQLEYKVSTAANWRVKSVSSTATTYTVTGLVNQTNYTFRIKAQDKAGNWTLYSDEVTCVPIDNVPPEIPAGLKVSAVNDGLVTLGWTAVKATDLGGYQLEYQKDGEATWTEVSLGKVVTHTITGLTNDEEYNFRIKARDTLDNWSAYSDEIKGTPSDKTAPAVPTELSASIGNDKDVTLTWHQNSETDLGGYEIAYQKSGAATWSSVTASSTETTKSIDGLVQNTTYYFKIRAKDLEENYSGYSAKVKAIPKDQVPPTQPEGLVAAPGDKSVVLTWTANAETDLAGYQLEYKASISNTWQIRRLSSTTTTYTVTYLTNGTSYDFRIKAKDKAGNWSEYSEINCTPTS